MDTNIDFIQADTRKSFFSMALPLMAAMFLNLAYNIVDSIWIGNLLGETAMAALTSAMPIIFFLMAIAMGTSNGLSILISQRIGAKKDLTTLVTTSFVFSLVFPILLTIILEIGLTAILKWLQTPEEIINMAFAYLSVYLLGYITVFIYMYFTALLRSHGNTILQATAILLCTILNAVLDPVFIKLMGFHGAAVATLISQCIAAAILVFYLVRKRLFSIRIKAFDFSLIPKLVKAILPSIIQQSTPAISATFITALVSGFGITSIAAYGIAGKIETMLLYPAMAFNMTLTAIVGQCMGGRRIDRTKDYLKSAFLYGGGFVLFLAIFVVAFAGPLSNLFVNTVGVASIVSEYFLLIGIGYVFAALTNNLLGTLNGMGKPAVGMLLVLFSHLMIRIPFAWLLSGRSMGLSGIWFAILISHITTFVIVGIAYKVCLKDAEFANDSAASGNPC